MAIRNLTNNESEEPIVTASSTKLKIMAKKIKVSSNLLEPFVDIIVSAESYATKYKELQKIGEGSYSTVIQSKNRATNARVAVKKLKHSYRDKIQVEAIPEIRTLRRLPSHPNILQMLEIHFDPNSGRVCLVFELMEMNLYELIKDRKRLLAENRVRGMLFQLMRALRHLHRHGIFHRDVKPENILVQSAPLKPNGEERDIIKLADLGSVRDIGSKPPYTEYISTRWYRSPECLLTSGRYNIKMDVWAAGCVFYEVLTLRPLFPGTSEIDQINKIHNILGMPSEKVLEKFAYWTREGGGGRPTKLQKQSRLDVIKGLLHNFQSRSKGIESPVSKQSPFAKLLPSNITKGAHDLLRIMLEYDAELRPSPHRVLQHDYFQDSGYPRIKSQMKAKEMAQISTAREEGLVAPVSLKKPVIPIPLPTEVKDSDIVNANRKGNELELEDLVTRSKEIKHRFLQNFDLNANIVPPPPPIKKLESKPSLTTVTTLPTNKDFNRRFIDRNKLNVLAISRMNEVRRILNMNPLGNSTNSTRVDKGYVPPPRPKYLPPPTPKFFPPPRAKYISPSRLTYIPPSRPKYVPPPSPTPKYIPLPTRKYLPTLRPKSPPRQSMPIPPPRTKYVPPPTPTPKYVPPARPTYIPTLRPKYIPPARPTYISGRSLRVPAQYSMEPTRRLFQ